MLSAAAVVDYLFFFVFVFFFSGLCLSNLKNAIIFFLFNPHNEMFNLQLHYACLKWSQLSCTINLGTDWCTFFQVNIKAYYLLLLCLCTPEWLLVDSQCNTCAKITSNSYSSPSSLSLDLQNERFLDMPPSELPEHCFSSVNIVFEVSGNACIMGKFSHLHQSHRKQFVHSLRINSV